MGNEEKQKTLVASTEEQTISRSMMSWINSCPELPQDISRVNFEQFQVNTAGQPLVPSMALSVIQGTYITRRYITGGHEGEYAFSIFYRIRPGNSNDARLSADETLNAIGDWARDNLPDIGENVRVIKIEPTARAALLGVTESGEEDHQIPLRMIYETT